MWLLMLVMVSMQIVKMKTWKKNYCLTGSLKDLTTAIKHFTESAIAIEENDMVTAFNQFSNASSELINSQNHIRKLLNGTAKVSPDQHIWFLWQKLYKINFQDQLMTTLLGGETEQPLEISASSSFTTWHSGKIADIVDNNDVKSMA